jgi:hypothetical protein
MLISLISCVTAYVFGADNHYTSHPSDYYNTRDELYGSYREYGYPYGPSSHSIYGDLGLGAGHFSSGRGFIKDDDLLQRRYMAHGLSNHWLSD